MTPERFAALAEAYGGDVVRWPEADREAAAALMVARPGWARDVLAGAGDLDAALGAYPAPRASAGLADRIAAGAPRPRPRWVGWLLPAGMGAGLAAACAAGVMAGAQLHAASSTATASDPDAVVTAVTDEDFSLYLDEDA